MGSRRTTVLGRPRRREAPPATTAERWRLLEAIERSRSAGGTGVSGGGRNATLGSRCQGARSPRADAVRRGGPAHKRGPHRPPRPINEH